MLQFRKMLPSDLDLVVRLEHECFEDPWPAEAFSPDIIETGYVLIKEDVLIGYVFALMVMDECSLINVAISPAEQRQGYGEYMMTELISLLRADKGIRYYYLDVRTSNIPAQRLYTKLGFKHLGIRKAYYRKPPEDAIVMGLIIP